MKSAAGRRWTGVFAALAMALPLSARGLLPPARHSPLLSQVPGLRIVGWDVIDAPDGNADGGLHPGETAFLRIHLSNQGSEPAYNVAGTLSEVTDRPGVLILDKVALWPDLPATGTPAVSSGPYLRIRTESTLPCHAEVPLRLSDSGIQVVRPSGRHARD